MITNQKVASRSIPRFFTTPDTHPYDLIQWETRDAKITKDDGTVVFQQDNIEVPAFWSETASTIVASKYFRGQLKSPERERSVKHMVSRVVNRITVWGTKDGYFANDEESCTFAHELKHIIVNQCATFNSPVWFNIGCDDRAQQASACFLIDVEDTMESILNWYCEEALIFRGGSGAGLNVSKIRSKHEGLSGGGEASGVLSFMKAADASAGVIQSGGKNRRAAKMVILDVDHPEIFDFIWAKVHEERKARALVAMGYDDAIDGEAYRSVAFQNTNHSINVTDDFLQKAIAYEIFCTMNRVSYEGQEHKAEDILRQMAKACWECADPGIQFIDTINRWHTCPTSGSILSSNPCSEYYFIPNTACNLACINLLKYLKANGSFDIEAYCHTVDVLITAQEILVGRADYPTPAITQNSHDYRTLGLGYSNLGALLMAKGLPYDSDAGRDYAASITALMTGRAYRRSAELAALQGPFAGFEANKVPMMDVILKHADALVSLEKTVVTAAACEAWNDAFCIGDAYGYRNAQVSLLMPGGCVTEDTMVLSSAGLLPIKYLGDTHGSQWQKTEISVMQETDTASTTHFYRNGQAEVFRVITVRGHELKGTAKHRIRVIGPLGEYVWKCMKDISVGDIVSLRIGGHEELLENKEYQMAVPANIQDHRDRRFQLPLVIDEGIAEIFGYYVGNGYLKAGVKFTVPNTSPDVIASLQDWIISIGGTPGLEYHAEETNIYVAGIYLQRWFENNDCIKERGNHGEGSASAHIPICILQSRTSVLTAFLRGLFEAGGTVTLNTKRQTPSIEFSTVSARLALEVHTALEALGMQVNVQSQSGRSDRKGSRVLYRIRLVSIADCAIFLKKIGFMSERKQAVLEAGIAVPSSLERGQTIHHQELIDDLYQVSVGLPNAVRQDIASRKYEGSFSCIWAKRMIHLYPQLSKTKLGKLFSLGSLQFVQIETAENIGVHETYDLSVPQNNTYVANGFISHNTVSLMMDCATTGVEPDVSLVNYKKLVGGGTIKKVNPIVERALQTLGYNGTTAEIMKMIETDGGPYSIIREEHVPIFDCAFPSHPGGRAISWHGHVKMVGALQPFLSGGISKTINMPHESTVEDIEEAFLLAWKLGCKSIAIYRDGCKQTQVLTTQQTPPSTNGVHPPSVTHVDLGVLPSIETQPAIEGEAGPKRKRLPDERPAITHKFCVGGQEGYFTCGLYEDGSPAELFVHIAKEGSTLGGVMDAWATLLSFTLQYGVPLADIIGKLRNARYEPMGFTSHPDIHTASSLTDYIVQWLHLKFVEGRTSTMPVLPSQSQQGAPLREKTWLDTSLNKRGSTVVTGTLNEGSSFQSLDMPLCSECGSITRPSGSCYVCIVCGSSSGCS